MKRKIYCYLLLLSLNLINTACSTALSGATHMDLSNLEFTCVHEAKPPLSADTQQLYNYARYHDLHNMWNGKDGDTVWQNAAVYYRIAAANGDYKANVRLQYLLRTGRVNAPNAKKETLALNEILMKQLPGTAHYHSYLYLKHGYGLRGADELAYLRKAADLGSKEAQYDLAEILGNIQDSDTLEFRKNQRIKLFACSSEQGNGNASKALGITHQIYSNYELALKSFQQGVKNGDSGSSLRLSYAFDGKRKKEGDMYFLSLTADAERQVRYKMIQKYLSRNDYLNPTVPDLDKIVPLPPAKLPAWDGKIAFQRWFEGDAPPKPSDELMKKLAEQAGLDWQTGLPLKK